MALSNFTLLIEGTFHFDWMFQCEIKKMEITIILKHDKPLLPGGNYSSDFKYLLVEAGLTSFSG